MNNLYKKIRTFYLRNKVSDFEYDCVRTEINQTNLSVISVCSTVVALVFLALGIASVLLKDAPFIGSPFLYFATFILVLSVSRFAKKCPSDAQKLPLLLMYAFMWILYFYASARGILKYRNSNSVVFVVLQFSFPIIFLDKSRRIYTNMAVAGILESIATLVFKDGAVAAIDIFYSWVFFFLSIIPSFYLTKTRVREFSLRQIVENERDTDQLTGLLNKSAFIREATKSLNSLHKGILIMLDLDKFKEVNDTYGHMVGDYVLKRTACCIQSVFRSMDFMGRFGGDEFVILMAGADQIPVARMRCETLLAKLNSTPVCEVNAGHTENILASVGFAFFDKDTFDSLFKKADKALYDAKNSGRNRFCQYHSETPSAE